MIRIWIWFCTSKELNHWQGFAFSLFLENFQNVPVYSSCQSSYFALQPLLFFRFTLSMQILPFLKKKSTFFALRRKIMLVYDLVCDWLMWLSDLYINVFFSMKLWKTVNKKVRNIHTHNKYQIFFQKAKVFYKAKEIKVHCFLFWLALKILYSIHSFILNLWDSMAEHLHFWLFYNIISCKVWFRTKSLRRSTYPYL